MDLVSELAKVEQGQNPPAALLGVFLCRGYIQYEKGKSKLTEYGKTVMNTAARR
jgi:hypothetical protein